MLNYRSRGELVTRRKSVCGTGTTDKLDKRLSYNRLEVQAMPLPLCWDQSTCKQRKQPECYVGEMQARANMVRSTLK